MKKESCICDTNPHICPKCRSGESFCTCEPKDTGWDKNCGVYQCSDGTHFSWWQAIVRTPEWRAWDEYNRGDKMMYDIPECEECGFMSEKHAKDFLEFVRTKYKPPLK